MNQFLQWFNQETKFDPVLRAAIAHVWFVIIHPFDDGNGKQPGLSLIGCPHG